MAEIVKRQRIKQNIPAIGSRVSVERNFFDSDDSNPYSSMLPDNIQRIAGTVIFTYEHSKKVRVKWDLDNTKNDIHIEDIQVEAHEFPLQSVSNDDTINDFLILFISIAFFTIG